MRFLPADVGRQPHHHGFGDDQPAADVEIFGHLLFIDNQPAESEFGLVQRACGEDKLSGIAIHSACHGPVARSKSCTIASSISPACWRTPLHAASISSDEIGLRFCGMVEDAPRPLTNGS